MEVPPKFFLTFAHIREYCAERPKRLASALDLCLENVTKENRHMLASTLGSEVRRLLTDPISTLTYLGHL